MSDCEYCGQHICGSECDVNGCSSQWATLELVELRAEVKRLKAPAKCICSSHGCNPDCEYEGHHENEMKSALKCIEQNFDLMQSRADKAESEVTRLKRGLKDLLAAYEALLPEDVNPGANAVSFKARQLIGGGE